MPAVITTAPQLKEAVKEFLKADAFSFDIETIGEHRGHPVRNEVSWAALATYGRTVVIPMGHPNGSTLISPRTRRKNKTTGTFEPVPPVFDAPPPQLRPGQVFAELKPLLYSAKHVKVAHNATFDFRSIAKYYGGELPPPPFGDTIVAAWLMNENAVSLGLKKIVQQVYGVSYDAEEVGKRVEDHSFATVATYAHCDARYTWLLWRRLVRALSRAELERVYALEMDVLHALLYMGNTGAPIDEAMLHTLEAELTARLSDIQTRIYRSAGQVFNLASPIQRQKVLFGAATDGGQELRPVKLTDGGNAKRKRGAAPALGDWSTDAEVLEMYPDNPVAAGLLEHAEVAKILGTYVRGYLGDADKDKPNIIFDGRIHPDLVQYGARTGRFSCRNPNLQNIPRPDTDLGRAIRGLFIAPEGHRLLVADYGQIELRVLAHYLRRGKLFEGFHAGVDAHTATACAVFGVMPDQVTKAMRQVAKALAFAIVYGAGPEKVAAMAGITLKEAKALMASHQAEFPEIYQFKEQVVATCRSRRPPHIITLMGRRRRLPEINYSDRGLRAYAERQAVNSLIQGSSADLIKLAMVRLHRAIERTPVRLILSVHDEIGVLAPDDWVERAAAAMREAMLGPGISGLLNVPLTTDVAVCQRWSDAK